MQAVSSCRDIIALAIESALLLLLDVSRISSALQAAKFEATVPCGVNSVVGEKVIGVVVQAVSASTKTIKVLRIMISLRNVYNYTYGFTGTSYQGIK